MHRRRVFTFHQEVEVSKISLDRVRQDLLQFSGSDICDLFEELYLIRKEETFEKLEEAGVSLDSTVKGAFLVRGLERSKYGSFIDLLKVSTVLNSTEVKSKFLKLGKQEVVTKLKEENEAERVEAYHATRGRSEKNQKGMTCYTCKEPGHTARICEKYHEARKRGAMLCYTCLKFNHTSKDCRYRKGNEENNNNPKRNSNSGAKSNEAKASASSVNAKAADEESGER